MFSGTGTGCQLAPGTMLHCSHLRSCQMQLWSCLCPSDMRGTQEASRLHHGLWEAHRLLCHQSHPHPGESHLAPCWRACYRNINRRQIAGAPVCFAPQWWQPHKATSDKTKRRRLTQEPSAKASREQGPVPNPVRGPVHPGLELITL